MSEDLQKKIHDKFKVDEEEILEKKLDSVEGWFNLTKDQIELSSNILDLANKWQYLSYLIASKIGYYGDLRDEEDVKHQEADQFFGWSRDSGQTAKDYARDVSNYLTKTKGGSGRKIPPGKFKESVDKIKEKLGEKE